MSDKKIFSRRDFLNSLASTIGSTSVLAVTSSSIKAEPNNQTSHEGGPLSVAKGYQHTKHVETYYSLADL